MSDPEGGASLPRYIQISEMLIREIAAGRRADGSRLPAEREMAADLGVSVGTLRKALSDLEGKGLLERVQGSGNYVRSRAAVASVYAFFRLELPEGGGLPTAEVISVSREAKPAGAPTFGPGAEGHRIRRVRRLDGVPVALEEIWLDGARAERLTREDLSESLYEFYRDGLGLVIGRIEDRIWAAPPPEWGEGLPVETAVDLMGYIERLSFDAYGQAVEFSRTWFDNDKARYVSRLGKG